MSMKSPRGTDDLLPKETGIWKFIENELQELCERYHFKEIRTPIFEHTEVYQRGVGETTDIVQKEMYTFLDQGDRSITLRPEGTAGVARAYIQNKLHGEVNQPIKVYYNGPMFRYERQQEGRRRQFHQFGVEALGSEDPAIDAEVIALGMSIYERLGIESIELVINSLGDIESRKAHREALIEHFTPHIDELCSDCQTRLTKNPLRVLDCKVDMDHAAMDTAPEILQFLNDESAEYFEKVKQYLDTMDIPYVIDPTLVRGLDYYNHTAFEIMGTADGFGAHSTLLGGGRYDGLVEQFDGPPTPGVGFALGMERLLLALEHENIELPIDDALDVFIVTIGDEVSEEGVRLLYELRNAGLKADKDYQGRGVRAQFRAADRLKAKFVIIIGEEELNKGTVNLRTMADREETEVDKKELVNILQEKLGGNE